MNSAEKTAEEEVDDLAVHFRSNVSDRSTSIDPNNFSSQLKDRWSLICDKHCFVFGFFLLQMYISESNSKKMYIS